MYMPMKKYSVSLVRRRLAEALDEADRGRPVIIERNGVNCRLSVERRRRPAPKASPSIEILDSAVADAPSSPRWTCSVAAATHRRARQAAVAC
jgi:hypothetical protein